MIGRIIGSGRGIAGMVAYITHDQISPDERRPTTSERVAWTACLGIPTEDTELMVRAMQGLTADAPVLKTRAGISSRGRKLKNSYTHLVLRLARGRHCPGKAGHAVGCRRRARQPRSRPPPLRGLRRALRHKLPHVHIAVSRVDPETGRAVNLDKGATRRPSRWAEQYEHDHGGIVVPTCRTARGAGGPPRHRATAPQRQHAAVALAVQLELGVGNRPPPGAIEPNRTLPCAPPHRPAAGRVARAARVRMTAGAKETATRFLSLRTSGGGPQRAGCNVARSRPPTVQQDGVRCRRARCTR